MDYESVINHYEICRSGRLKIFYRKKKMALVLPHYYDSMENTN